VTEGAIPRFQGMEDLVNGCQKNAMNPRQSRGITLGGTNEIINKEVNDGKLLTIWVVQGGVPMNGHGERQGKGGASKRIQCRNIRSCRNSVIGAVKQKGEGAQAVRRSRGWVAVTGIRVWGRSVYQSSVRSVTESSAGWTVHRSSIGSVTGSSVGRKAVNRSSVGSVTVSSA